MPYKDKEKQKATWRRYYYKNQDKIRRSKRRRRRKTAAWLREYKQGLKCATCSFAHPAAISFHHPEEKDSNISGNKNYWGIERLIEEIEKCTVLCENCHRILHYEERSGAWRQVSGVTIA